MKNYIAYILFAGALAAGFSSCNDFLDENPDNRTTVDSEEKAIDMLDMAYIPYSHFPVGAALLCKDGTVFTGCNIENAAYGATICAERTAIFKAVSEGHRDFETLVIAGRSDDYCVPCGTCRQVMMEFAPELTVICLNKNGESKKFALKELLPYGFDQSWL